jgi:hypothetical protein
MAQPTTVLKNVEDMYRIVSEIHKTQQNHLLEEIKRIDEKLRVLFATCTIDGVFSNDKLDEIMDEKKALNDYANKCQRMLTQMWTMNPAMDAIMNAN